MAMAENEKGDTASSKEGGAWGTLEELLLVCAVSRHGTESWDSISMELQKRASIRSHGESYTNDFSNSFTPQNCEHKYQALKRRFEVTGGGDEDDGLLPERLSFMVDELRKLRVDELRCQVERHDVSIVSLQLKVKRLEDERKKSSSEEEVGGADLVAKIDRSDADEQKTRSSEEMAEKSAFSGRSDEPEDGSFNESNSGGASGRRRESNQREEADPAVPVAESAPEKDCSSSYDLEKGGRVVVGKASPRLGNSGESLSESKREARQSSDVQSSASLSRRKRRGWRRSNGVGSSGDDEMEMETEEWSPSNKRKDVKSQLLIKFFEIVRSHKHGSVFQRRLPSQETEKYRNLIRQHLDLESVQSKLDGGVYNECHSKFYRDLLLIFTNALLFFCKSSTEHAAGRELRKLVMKEIIAQRVPRKPKPEAAPAPALLAVKPDHELESSKNLDPVVKKPRSSNNIVVCRRRTNSNATKPPPLLLLSEKSSAKSKEEEPSKVESSLETKPKNNANANANASSGDKKGKGESNNSNNKSNKTMKKGESSDEEEQPINMRRKQLVSSSKKQGVVNFLKRMQQKPNESEELEEEKRKKKGGEMSKKKVVVVGKKKDEDEDEAAAAAAAAKRRISGRRSSTSKGGGDEGEKPETTVKRSGSGRPPKRKAAMGGGGGGTPDSGRLKMRRDGTEDKEAGGGGSGKIASTAKRSRRS